MKNQNTSRSGFTLIELLVVVLIIGILSAIALPKYQKAVNKARIAEYKTNLSSVYKAANAYFLENPADGHVFASALDVDASNCKGFGKYTSCDYHAHRINGKIYASVNLSSNGGLLQFQLSEDGFLCGGAPSSECTNFGFGTPSGAYTVMTGDVIYAEGGYGSY